ncbi:hypothetical protein LCGC14_3082910 [marine sediment metagenome]|uniref:Uncharacterized protein n=1 Tax=marine sediment metagenome TaxID=412755 RepID=A0A0F8WCN5_9ZZZZ
MGITVEVFGFAYDTKARPRKIAADRSLAAPSLDPARHLATDGRRPRQPGRPVAVAVGDEASSNPPKTAVRHQAVDRRTVERSGRDVRLLAQQPAGTLSQRDMKRSGKAVCVGVSKNKSSPRLEHPPCGSKEAFGMLAVIDDSQRINHLERTVGKRRVLDVRLDQVLSTNIYSATGAAGLLKHRARQVHAHEPTVGKPTSVSPT